MLNYSLMAQSGHLPSSHGRGDDSRPLAQTLYVLCLIADGSNRLFGSGSPHNVPAGHYVNLDKVTEHYRKQHLDDEERKAKRLAEAKKE